MDHVIERFRLGKYVVLRLDGNHPLFPGSTLEYEHRVVMAEHMGRSLVKGEVVHHERETWNNDIEYLVLKASAKDHVHDHHRRPMSEETKAKISAANRGRVMPPGHGQKISDRLSGIVRSDNFKRKVSEGMTKRCAEYGGQTLGHSLTQEHKDNIGRAGRGRKRSQEFKDRMSAIQLELGKSDDRCALLSQRATEAWADPAIRKRQVAAIRAAWAQKRGLAIFYVALCMYVAATRAKARLLYLDPDERVTADQLRG